MVSISGINRFGSILDIVGVEAQSVIEDAESYHADATADHCGMENSKPL